MTGCMMTPDEFTRQLLEAGKQHKRIGVIKFWNMCCVQCSSRPPIAIVLTELSDAQLIAAHGMSDELQAHCRSTVTGAAKRQRALAQHQTDRTQVPSRRRDRGLC
eukprot:3282103-Prymnesium_polylepis.1